MTIITQEHENEQQFSGRVKDFFRRYQISDILRRCNAYKHSGVPVIAVVSYLFCLVFRNRSMYLDMSSDRKGFAFGRDTVYRLKNSVRINWERFTTLLSARIITESLQPAVSEKRRDVLA